METSSPMVYKKAPHFLKFSEDIVSLATCLEFFILFLLYLCTNKGLFCIGNNKKFVTFSIKKKIINDSFKIGVTNRCIKSLRFRLDFGSKQLKKKDNLFIYCFKYFFLILFI